MGPPMRQSQVLNGYQLSHFFLAQQPRALRWLPAAQLEQQRVDEQSGALLRELGFVGAAWDSEQQLARLSLYSLQLSSSNGAGGAPTEGSTMAAAAAVKEVSSWNVRVGSISSLQICEVGFGEQLALAWGSSRGAVGVQLLRRSGVGVQGFQALPGKSNSRLFNGSLPEEPQELTEAASGLHRGCVSGMAVQSTSLQVSC